MIDIGAKYIADLAANTGDTVPASVILKDTFMDPADANDKELSTKFSAIGGYFLNTSGNMPNFDPTAKTFTVYGYSRIVCGEKVYILRGIDGQTASSFILDISAYSTGIISYDTINNIFTVRAHTATTIPRTEVAIATYYLYGAKVSMSAGFTINSLNPALQIEKSGYLPIIHHATKYPNVDSLLKTLTIYANSTLSIRDKVYSLSSPDIVVDISIYESGNVLFDPADLSFSVSNITTATIPINLVLIASYSQYGAMFSMTGGYTINENNPVRDSKPPEDVIAYEYTYTDLTTPVITDWSDFIIYNNQYIMFAPSTDEDHVAFDGLIHVVDYATNTLVKTLTHNLGHCNTVHYDSINDKLMIGNLPGSTAHPAALYILNDFSTLLTGASIDFDTVDKTVIDLSASSYAVSQIAACFCENNMDRRDLVFVTALYGHQNMKIQLGTGANDLGEGVFVAVAVGEFNGSFKIIDTYDYVLQSSAGTEVTQGIAYHDGRIYTSNGHESVRGAIMTLNNNSTMDRKRIVMTPYGLDGVMEEMFCEGCDISGGILHIGCIHDAKRKIIKINI